MGGRFAGLIGGGGGRGWLPILPSGDSSIHSCSSVYFFSSTGKEEVSKHLVSVAGDEIPSPAEALRTYKHFVR